jgi:hypothetical protein
MQAIKEEGVFITEEQGRTIEHTEKQRLWRSAQGSDQTPREAQQLHIDCRQVVCRRSRARWSAGIDRVLPGINGVVQDGVASLLRGDQQHRVCNGAGIPKLKPRAVQRS